MRMGRISARRASIKRKGSSINRERSRIVLQARPPFRLSHFDYFLLIVVVGLVLACIIELEQENESLRDHMETLQSTCSGM